MDSLIAYFISFVVLIITYAIYKLYWTSRLNIKCVIHEGISCKIATTSKACSYLINELKSSQPKMVGFDIEWSSKKGDENQKVSLIQLAHKDLIILIRMNLIQNIPGELHGFLGDVEILKTGIAIFDDKYKLNLDYNLDVNGCIDINHIFNNKLSIQQQNELKAIYYEKNIDDLTREQLNNSLGLNTVSIMFLKRKMKYKNISSYKFHEEWNNHQLTNKHIHYAADDALVGYKAFIELIELINNTQNVENIMDHSLNPYISICDGLIDIKTVKKQKQKSSKDKTQKNKTKKEKKSNNKYKLMNPNQLFTNNDRFSYRYCNKLQLKYNNLIKFHLSTTKYRRNMNELRDEINTINNEHKSQEMDGSNKMISWGILFEDDKKTDDIPISSESEEVKENEISESKMNDEDKKENVDDYAFYCKCKDDIFHLNSTAFDTRIYINNTIDLKMYIDSLETEFYSQYELGILIKTSMGANNFCVGAWNIGFVLGSNIFAYHPGYDKQSTRYGAARCEGVNGWNTESMGFIPDTNKMQTFEIFINRKSHIYLKIIQDEYEYIRDWQHRDSLFMDDGCSIFIPCCFGIRIENSKGNKHQKGKRVGRYGDIEINVGQRNLKHNQISGFDDK